ncbi:MAG: CCA tRNA nucleotidyltransferase [Endomicrobium sp.]|jgi:tRNA nucleotidyltransferase/poly(A) polymerase|nr:CCA tRNA nucleotidyltransferase [Endomicrobium sp.]
MNITVPDKFAGIIDKILQTAVEKGYETYAVGGFVRDLFIGREPKDLDIMVENINDRADRLAGINFSRQIAAKFDLGEPVVFERFGTAKLFIDGEEVEFVMPRKEYYDSSSRNPDTEIGTLGQDALRRDFTVNALFLSLNDMRVLDFTSKGLKDIEDKIIRIADPSNSAVIFNQDPLRILRAVRQSLQLGFSIETETYKEMKVSPERIKIVSPERVRDEINKILAEKKPSEAFKMLDDIDLLGEILPEISRLKNLKQPEKYHADDVYNHTLKVLDRTEPELVLRMSALLHDSGKFNAYKETGGKITFYGHENESVKIAGDVLKRLKYPKEFAQKVSAVIKNHMYPKTYSPQWGDAAVRRFAKAAGENLESILALSRADYGKTGGESKIGELISRMENLKTAGLLCLKDELVNGAEILKYFNMPRGAWVGEVKNKIEELRLENPKITKKEALETVKTLLKIK